MAIIDALLDPATLPGYWLVCFAFSQAVEVPVYVLATRPAVPRWRAAAAGAACTCVTHPLLWFVWPRVISWDHTAYVVSGELGVGVVESLLFWRLARPVRLSRAVAVAFLANAASYGLWALLPLRRMLLA